MTPFETETPAPAEPNTGQRSADQDSGAERFRTNTPNDAQECKVAHTGFAESPQPALSVSEVSLTEQSLLNRISHPVFVLIPDEYGTPRYAYLNSSAREAARVTNDQIIGKCATQLYPGISGQVALAHHRKAMISGQPATYELTLPMAARSVRFRTTLQPECDSNGRVVRLIGSSASAARDGPAPRREASAEKRVTAIQDFITLAAHDLRAPIGQIQSLTDLLIEDFTDMGDGKTELLHMIRKVTTKTQHLITDVLSYAQAIEVSDDPLPFSFDDAVREVVGMLDPFGQAKCIISEGHVLAEARAVQVVLRNLIDNALKHNHCSAEHPVSLTIKLHDHGSEIFGFSVGDNGSGFSDGAAMFLDSGRFRTESGFGLLGVRRLVESRGGSISAADNSDGPGAMVTVLLPGQVLPKSSLSKAAQS